MSDQPQIITVAERLSRKVGGCKTCGQKSSSMDASIPKPPSNWQMLKNLVQAAKEAVAGGFDVRSPEDMEKALNICAECPLLVQGDSPRCGSCGCVLGTKRPDGSISFGKVFFKDWHCPLNKW